ncbi:MAG: hypothetical protein HC808_05465 [Candidatus Competibacteraceae bacterium]|nr:hypothetical protein [Candidatus Competibacteraceae bacterium]
MKQPQIANIPDPTPETSFSERAKEAKRKQTKSGAKAVKKSFSLTADDVSFIEKLALKLGQKRGKSMTDSEALRTIIEFYRGQQ